MTTTETIKEVAMTIAALLGAALIAGCGVVLFLMLLSAVL